MFVQDATMFHQFGRRLDVWRQIADQHRERMTPCLPPQPLKQGLQGFFRSLLGGKATPFIIAVFQCIPGMAQVRLSLSKPVCVPVGHRF